MYIYVILNSFLKMSQQLSIENYTDALNVLQDMVQKVVPIKKTAFIEDHKLDARFFKVLEEMGVLEILESSKLGGFVFDWKYSKPSNTTAVHLATRVTGAIYELNQKAYTYYSSEEYKLKKAKKEHKEKEKRERQAILDERAKAKQQVQVKTKDQETIILDVSPIIQHQGPIQPPAPPIETVPVHSQVTFSLAGSLNRAELISKLLLIIEDQPISNFRIEVDYSN